MTEIQWLVDILMNFKLPQAVRERFIARIGEVEAQMSARNRSHQPSFGPIRAPVPVSAQVETTPAREPIIPKEVIVHSGNGTTIKGPRKF